MDKKTIFQRIVSLLGEMQPDLVNSDQVTYDSILSLLGASSVERAELIERMLEDLDLQANRFDFHSASNLGELAELLFESYQSQKDPG